MWVPTVLRGTSSSSAPRDLPLLGVISGLLSECPLLLADQLPGGRLLGGQLGVRRFVLPFKILGFLHRLQLWLDKLGICQHSQYDSHLQFIRWVNA